MFGLKASGKGKDFSTLNDNSTVDDSFCFSIEMVIATLQIYEISYISRMLKSLLKIEQIAYMLSRLIYLHYTSSECAFK